MAVVGFDIRFHVRSGAEEPLALRNLSLAFERAAVDASRWSEFVFPRVVAILEDEVNLQFEGEGVGPRRGSWAPLKPKYAAWKARHFPGRAPLVRTGRLRAALTQSSAGGALRHYTRTELRYGTAGVPYASFHQTGTDRMVDRPPFDFGPDAEARLKGESLEAMRELVRASRLDRYATFNAGSA